ARGAPIADRLGAGRAARARGVLGRDVREVGRADREGEAMNACVLRTPRELERLVAAALADERGLRWVIEPELLARTLHVAGWCPAEALSAAERELVRVHRT